MNDIYGTIISYLPQYWALQMRLVCKKWDEHFKKRWCSMNLLKIKEDCTNYHLLSFIYARRLDLSRCKYITPSVLHYFEPIIYEIWLPSHSFREDQSWFPYLWKAKKIMDGMEGATTDEDMKYIPEVEYLDISRMYKLNDGRKFDGTGLLHLKKIKILDLGRLSIVDSSFHSLSLPFLTSLFLYGCEDITDLGLESMSKAAPNIERLDIRYCDGINGSSLPAFKNLCHLTVSHIPALSCALTTVTTLFVESPTFGTATIPYVYFPCVSALSLFSQNTWKEFHEYMTECVLLPSIRSMYISASLEKNDILFLQKHCVSLQSIQCYLYKGGDAHTDFPTLSITEF